MRGPSIPQRWFCALQNIRALECWVARSSRAMTVLLCFTVIAYSIVMRGPGSRFLSCSAGNDAT
jgi:hypothetical protein